MSAALFDKLRQMNLPPQGYAIFGSGPLAIRGIIPSATDLDIICRNDVWNRVSSMASIEYLPQYDVTVAKMFDGALSFGTQWGIGNFDVDELIATAEIFDALPFVRLAHVIAYKKLRASAKDLQHIDALKMSGYS